jgi:HD-GYP domain-containing protein (c-di-GMP phosphodiesterase class II)
MIDAANIPAEVRPLWLLLSQQFESGFELWKYDHAWDRIVPECTVGKRTIFEEAGFSRSLLDSIHDSDAPSIHALAGRRHFLLLPIWTEDGCCYAAAGIVDGESVQLLRTVGSSIQSQFRQQLALHDQQLSLEAYAEQVSLDFEELTWLRSLTEQIEYCDVSNPLETVSRQVLPRLREIVGAETLVFVEAVRSRSGTAESASRVGAPALWSGKQPFDDAACTELVRTILELSGNRQVVMNNLERLGTLPQFPELHSCIVVPVALRNFHVGWLAALNRIRRIPTDATDNNPLVDGGWENEFGTVQASIMSSAAVMLAAQARNAELFRDKELMLIGVIRSLINAMDAKDTYTCGHSDRVAQIAKRIGLQMGLDEEECERLYMTGLLHDIGKIGVPDAILTKPGRLTDEEFAEIKKHPTIGHEILKHLTQLHYVLPGMLHHHESLDGTGYPHRLAGDQIPLFARILAVADSFDAMTSSRPYRKAMPLERAESILRDGSGKQWDANVINAFFDALPDIMTISDIPDQNDAAEEADNAVPVSTRSVERNAIELAVAATHE